MAHCRDVWSARLRLKIKICTWQLALDRLSTCDQLAKRLAQRDGLCSLCGQVEDATHILFSCVLAKLGWIVVRQLLGCCWCPANFPQFFAILHSLLGQQRRTSWVLFPALCWALWTTHNKLTIESRAAKHPDDVVYKMLMFLQAWTKLAKHQYRERLWSLADGLKTIYTTLVSSRVGVVVSLSSVVAIPV